MRASSIQRKVFGVISALTACLVAFLVTYFPARHMDFVRRVTRDKAALYARVLAREAEPVVAFDDRETARELFQATSQDADIRSLALVGASGAPLEISGEPSSLVAPAGLTDLRMESEPGLVRAMIPVVSHEGPRGVLFVELTTDAIAAEEARIRRTALGLGLIALLLGFVAAWAISRSLAQRLGAIARATNSVASGDLESEPIADDSSDEVGQLARSFNAMASNIRALVAQISANAANERQRLDGLVAERTARLDARNRDMRLVLDNVGQGFFTVDLAGHVSDERSVIAEKWLGKPKEGASFAEWIGQSNAHVGFWLGMGWSALADGLMPLELSLDQLPKTLERNGSCLAFAYTPIFDDGGLAKILVVISDVTSENARMRIEADQREFQNVFERIVRDRVGFTEFFAEASELVGAIGAAPDVLTVELRRALHTLKGNSAIFGLTTLTRACHALEDTMAETGRPPTEEQRQDIARIWASFTARARMLLGHQETNRIEVDRTEYDRLLANVCRGMPRGQFVRELAMWSLEPTKRRLERLADQARATAARLGKPDLRVEIEHHDLRTSSERWAPFWAAFTHVLRNAIDHGIEDPEKRAALGKTEGGLITLRTLREKGRFVVEVEDDGRGIDWGAVRSRANVLGFEATTDAQLADLLFADGFSTKHETTELSGRGVGLGAARAQCTMLGGSVSVRTAIGQGTTFRFSLPEAAMLPSNGLPGITPSRTSLPAVAALG